MFQNAYPPPKTGVSDAGNFNVVLAVWFMHAWLMYFVKKVKNRPTDMTQIKTHPHSSGLLIQLSFIQSLCQQFIFKNSQQPLEFDFLQNMYTSLFACHTFAKIAQSARSPARGLRPSPKIKLVPRFPHFDQHVTQEQGKEPLSPRVLWGNSEVSDGLKIKLA